MHHMLLLSEEVKILKQARKRRRLTCRDFNWWNLADMVHKGALEKVIPKKGKNAGWPYFIVSRRGRKFLKTLQEPQRSSKQGGSRR